MTESACRLSAAMQRAVHVQSTSGGNADELAEEMLKLFAAHGNLGHLPDFGHNAKAALLTKLAGGIRAWEGQGIHAHAQDKPARA